MGIDVTLNWVGQSLKEKDTQRGLDLERGRRGYLHEGYHGGPYVTRHLVAEAFDSDVAMPAVLLRRRLPFAVLLATYRDHVVYEEGTDPRKEATLHTLTSVLDEISEEIEASVRPAKDFQPTPAQLQDAETLIASRQLSPRALTFVDFVELAERKEAETGEPCIVSVSW